MMNTREDTYNRRALRLKCSLLCLGNSECKIENIIHTVVLGFNQPDVILLTDFVNKLRQVAEVIRPLAGPVQSATDNERIRTVFIFLDFLVVLTQNIEFRLFAAGFLASIGDCFSRFFRVQRFLLAFVQSLNSRFLAPVQYSLDSLGNIFHDAVVLLFLFFVCHRLN